ncbi:MAG: hypothetical protein M3041_06460 [Acidobacteriota bacterium]|nr:hypothetical protein [Acidobacteriota bacterium]
MTRRLPILLITLLLFGVQVASADHEGLRLLGTAWPDTTAPRLSEIGRGVGVVFSPDLSVAGNCRFYQALGFACFQDADWSRVLDQIHRHNIANPDRRIYTLVLETHGTNGNGLKLQKSYSPTAERSYIAVGALQERLESEGVFYVIISACNSGRLLRPYIYGELDPYNGDRLFLPATCGIVNASKNFDPARNAVTIITPQSSHIETTLVGGVRELAPKTQKAILASARALRMTPPTQFAVSDMMVQMLTRDSRLELAANRYVEELSGEVKPVDSSEALFKRFVNYVNAVALREKTSTTRVTSRGVQPSPSRSGGRRAGAAP